MARSIIVLGIVAFSVAIACILLPMFKATSVPSYQFLDALRKLTGSPMDTHLIGSSMPLPLALRIRFPDQISRGIGIFSPDRTDIYILNSASGDIDCIAHIRRDKVCYVTLKGNVGVEAMREKIRDLFPGLSVD